ncbi:U3 small nucleolar RNA-associated protein 15 homolog [Bactrocera neohumeralis]|uniref:U3 small nucleolar RNA-associated protein 15 homolog n=1 Tax=Bactrocera neohumeralis TaxID=98809 RepID=UPI002166665B|nr:U3 small nucleolar RNA-associated protein 15 homolog [Bactrocera neohumeralis]
MSQFKRLNTKKYLKTGKIVTPDTIYWKQLSVPTLVKEFGAIDYVDFSPIEPHYFAVTCSVRVQIYNPITKLVVKNLSRFQETAYGGTFRQDGRLLVAGDEQGLVKLFDPSSKNVLRLFKGHRGPVHRAQFTQDLLHIASFSDDRTVKLWDIASEKATLTFAEHEDYIRAGAINPMSPDTLISGGYDGKIKMYDTRTQQISYSIDHGSPVESLLFLPTGGIFISAGGTEMCVWDAFAGCRLLTKISQHHKTITSLRLGSNGKRLLSGSLDRHVKIYDVATYQTVHTLDFPNAVLSLGVAPGDQTVVAGMVDGLISIQNMEIDRNKDEITKRSTNKPPPLTSVKVDHEIRTGDFQKLQRYDNLLRRYEYVKCLDTVMKTCFVRRNPEVTISVMQELIHRKGLHRALAGRSHEFLSRMISFICNYIGEQRFMRVMIDVAMILLDVYGSKFHEFTGVLGKDFIRLAGVLRREVNLTYDLLELQGCLELLQTATEGSDSIDEMIRFVKADNDQLKQSAQAKESSILTV